MTLMTQPWNDWEDWAAGMYRPKPVRPLKVQESGKLLCDPGQFWETAREMTREWPVSAHHNLVKQPPSGWHAWIGQAACCYAHGATSEETRYAWGRLTCQTQRDANNVAAAVAVEFREGSIRGVQALFEH